VSISSPWIRLAIDWQDSPMFSREHGDSDASMGVRLAWVSLLCHMRSKGRGGKASVRKTAFCRDYNLTAGVVDEMLHRAQSHGAVVVNGDDVSLHCWACYQSSDARNKHVCGEKEKSSGGRGEGECPGFAGFWSLWPKHHRKADKRACEAKWRKLECEPLTDAILASLTAWKASEDWTKQDGQFVPAPLVWLNKRLWEAPAPPVAGTVGRTTPRLDTDAAMRLIPKRKGA
jgi:hypothetical protein